MVIERPWLKRVCNRQTDRQSDSLSSWWSQKYITLHRLHDVHVNWLVTTLWYDLGTNIDSNHLPVIACHCVYACQSQKLWYPHFDVFCFSLSWTRAYFDLKRKLDLQSIGSSPKLHILCARDTTMIPFTIRTWDSFLWLGGTGAYIWAWNMMPPLGTWLLPLLEVVGGW